MYCGKANAKQPRRNLFYWIISPYPLFCYIFNDSEIRFKIGSKTLIGEFFDNQKS